MDFSADATSAPYRLCPPPSRWGLMTKSSGLFSASSTASLVLSSGASSPSGHKPANVSRSRADSSAVMNLSSAPGIASTCCTFLARVPAKVLDRRRAVRRAQAQLVVAVLRVVLWIVARPVVDHGDLSRALLSASERLEELLRGHRGSLIRQQEQLRPARRTGGLPEAQPPSQLRERRADDRDAVLTGELHLNQSLVVHIPLCLLHHKDHCRVRLRIQLAILRVRRGDAHRDALQRLVLRQSSGKGSRRRVRRSHSVARRAACRNGCVQHFRRAEVVGHLVVEEAPPRRQMHVRHHCRQRSEGRRDGVELHLLGRRCVRAVAHRVMEHVVAAVDAQHHSRLQLRRRGAEHLQQSPHEVVGLASAIQGVF
eukprot:scaffold1130_cov195-Pinguiococcus_pyrenoidosus.AAC.92